MNFFALKAFQGFSEIPPLYWSFPDSSVGKESACNAGDPGSIPGLGRSCGEGNGYSLQYSGLEYSMGHYIVPGVTKRRTQLSDFSLHLTSVVLHPTGPQVAQPWTKQKAGRRGQRHREFARHGDLTQRSWGDSPVCIVDSRQDVAEASLLRGEGGFPLRGE